MSARDADIATILEYVYSENKTWPVIAEHFQVALTAAGYRIVGPKAMSINLYPYENGWRCDIDKGTGYHGIGADEPEAVLNAVLAWRRSRSLKGGAG